MWLLKGSRRDPCGDGNVLCLDCISVNILGGCCIIVLEDATLGELGPGYTGSPYISYN